MFLSMHDVLLNIGIVLFQAYFREFHIERLDRPWQAFTGSWSRAGLARHMGINASYVAANYCYVLVRLARHRVSKRVASTPEVSVNHTLSPITGYLFIRHQSFSSSGLAKEKSINQWIQNLALNYADTKRD